MIEGYSTAFDEDEAVTIVSKVKDFKEMHFDETFGNIAFKMTQVHEFSNPIEPNYLSAEVVTAVQGVLEVSATEKLDCIFNLEIKQARVKEFRSFFKSETTKEEFTDEWRTSYTKPLLDSFNDSLMKGIRFPYAHT